MKKLAFRLSVIIVLFISLIMTSYGQVSVKKVDGNNINSSTPGFYYSLPQTVLKVDIVYEKIQSLKGPLSSYATEYLGINDYISTDEFKYNLINVDLTSFSESDPNQLYFVQFPTEKAKDAKLNSFTFSDLGGLVAYNAEAVKPPVSENVITENTFIYSEGEDGFPYMSQYNKRKKTDTVVRTINIDTVVINRFMFKSSWVDKSDADKAKDAALQIEKLRESRYNLVSGYHEVNFGSSIIYMDHQLQKMEDQYLELFIGKTIKTIHNRTVYFVPDEKNNSHELLSFSDGKSVIIRIATENDVTPEGTTSTINNIFYRIPAPAGIDISSGNINYYTGRTTINQLGSIATVPLGNSSLLFNAESGNLVKIEQ